MLRFSASRRARSTCLLSSKPGSPERYAFPCLSYGRLTPPQKRERRRLVGIQALAMRLLVKQDSASSGLRETLAPLILRAIDALVDGETELALAALEAAQDELEEAA
jgi:hypothetical protein